jgi:hypothetical protein
VRVHGRRHRGGTRCLTGCFTPRHARVACHCACEVSRRASSRARPASPACERGRTRWLIHTLD